MASQVTNTESAPESTPSPAPLKVEKLKLEELATPSLDEQGNVLPYKDYDVKATESKYCKPSLIPKLAAAASLKKETPTAGSYGIEHSKEPLAGVKIPPECYLYDEDRPFVLGKLNKEALDYPEPCEPVPLSKELQDYLDALERAANDEINRRLRKERGELDENENIPATPVPPPPQAASEPKKPVEPLTSTPAHVKVTPETTETVKVAKKTTRTNAPSVSPAAGARRSSRSKTPTPSRSPRPSRPQTQIQQKPKQTPEKGKTPPAKSPGRGDGPTKVISPRGGPKKTVNAK